MKKTMILILALCLLLCGCADNDSPSTEAPETEATSTDTQIEETVDIPEGQEAITEPPKDTVTVYLQTRMARLDEDGNESWYREYAYDELGRLCAEREVLYSGEESYSAVITYAETESGLETIFTSPNGDVYTIRETLDDRGNVILREDIHDGYVDYYTEYTYDAAGNLISEETHYSEDPGVPRSEYTYDDRGNRIAHHQYFSDELEGWLEMTYDQDNRCTGTLYHSPDGTVMSRTEYTWEGNTQTHIHYDESGAAYMTTITTYDESGNILREETQQEGFVISSVEYTYEPFEIPAE